MKIHFEFTEEEIARVLRYHIEAKAAEAGQGYEVEYVVKIPEMTLTGTAKKQTGGYWDR